MRFCLENFSFLPVIRCLRIKPVKTRKHKDCNQCIDYSCFRGKNSRIAPGNQFKILIEKRGNRNKNNNHKHHFNNQESDCARISSRIVNLLPRGNPYLGPGILLYGIKHWKSFFNRKKNQQEQNKPENKKRNI